ncbi:non-hydrolyzing UDP-N-acetylglucosamine 2-epimerase [Sulfurovum mangrovi]|uniref:non-hydrolyzing UDP-N-acetylglucosamine 2-epimerase n=1 Tax=Sulfurovum mangrovi TaxID=2893889 RepID=UPI001E568DF1|nr:UDP-N-acetylglucosamine 2-epimerase (non-hydrolyzing) [Sulfurovum mangrovi]UFH59223.1 UDP-N-acetylglucosamine 2-epimerase (non-hydrolyzing) [Sulfurovum mangrovi]
MTSCKKILIVFGTRPEAIKMAPLVKAFQSYPETFETRVCVTAQHREMLDQVLELFEITPEYDLDIMKPGQDLYDVTSNVLLGMKSVLSDFKPDLVLVHGDTTTTSAASLAAFYQQIKVGHVEAGLRTGDIYSPWPEEANRQITGILANYHFAPTETSRENLLRENKEGKNIVVTGNTVIDALFLALEKIKNNTDLESEIISSINKMLPSTFQLPSNDSTLNAERSTLQNQKMILVTGHRRENHGQGFINICTALKEIALENPDIAIVYPVHLNPNVQKPVKELLSGIDNVHLIEPMQYEQFIYMMDKSYFIITDSGGVQEEAPSLGKPVLVMRDTTERPEALEAGTVKLVGTDSELIKTEAQKLIDDQEAYSGMSQASNPYGDGHACEKIVEFIKGSY